MLQDSLDFGLDAGEALWIRGPNGVGKSTLLETICGLRRRDMGRIAWQGRDINDAADDYHEAMAFIGHQNGNNASMTAREVLTFFARLYRVDAVEPALRRAEIWRQRDIPIPYLSAGQQRRLALARLTLVPRLLWILDEPTTSLDQAGIDWFGELMAEHRDAGRMAIFTSHVALPIADTRVLALERPSVARQNADDFLGDEWQGVI